MVSPTWPKKFRTQLYFVGAGGDSGLIRTCFIVHVRRPAQADPHGSRLWNGLVHL
jgi:hypothetical protein